ncbi:MAG: T9SS type A sorting domain-containing protein [Bacteroidia bacterium]|nr:T9SS type A sorting domain-containing protein [Bacteroidia bacterium]MDW8417058.1 CocE/NonD family hydrolase [Bacteroidia bacterium]
MANIPRLWLCAAVLWAQQPNGILDTITDLVSHREYFVRMRDSVPLATSVSLPIFSDTAQIDINLNSIIPGLGQRRLRFAYPGTQYFVYPDQPDPYALPVMFTRTPYNKGTADLSKGYAFFGYAGIEQDMRGRYRSWGVYLPMYSDSWEKTAYLQHLGSNVGHPLDITPTKEANLHEDGWDTYRWILDSLKYDSDRNGTLDAPRCNGKIGMFGASALGNTQYQLAAAHPIDPNLPGLKCLMPIVASGEFYHSAGHHNGVFRERLIDGWLRGQVEFYGGWTSGPADPHDSIHTIADYGPMVYNPFHAAEYCIDFWTTFNRAHYPNSPSRAVMDISHARLDANGNAQWRGSRSRYENIQVPAYNLTGWWDIFIDGQIQTWQYLMRHSQPGIRKFQKIVIGPWAHQTIGTRSTGDVRIQPDGRDHRYPPNVISDFNVPDVSELRPELFSQLAKSEVVGWFRYFLGTPTFQLPPDTAWQILPGSVLGDVYVRIPADTFRASFYEFLNFLNGTGPLTNFPIEFKIGANGTPQATSITIPATGQSLFGDTTGAVITPPTYEFDATQPNGRPNVRFYVVGPVADSINAHVGNYWYSSDTFPLPNLPRLRLYLHGDGSLSEHPPQAPEPPRAFVADPDDPVPTHGGPNMIVYTPDRSRLSQGQMDFNDPLYRGMVLDRPARYAVNGRYYSDLITYESDFVPESLCIAGFPIAQLYLALKPLWGAFSDSANGDVVVRVLDVYPDGREYYVFEGACNARAREYAESWADGQEDTSKPWYNLVSDSVYKWRFRMLPIAYCWGKGHRIKVLVSATNYPRYQPCPNVPLMPGEFFRRRPFDNRTYTFHGVPMNARRNLQTLFSAPDKPSYIELPVLGGRFVSSLPQNYEGRLTTTTIYPNPTQDRAVVEVSSTGAHTVEVYTLTGERIFRADFTQRLSLPVSDWQSGMYLVRVLSDQGGIIGTHKLVRY